MFGQVLAFTGLILTLLVPIAHAQSERLPELICADLLSEHRTAPHWKQPQITHYPESLVTYQNELVLKGKGNNQMNVNVEVENRRISANPQDLHAVLKMQIAQNAVPMALDLDKVLENWGLRKEGVWSEIAPEVEVVSVTPMTFGLDGQHVAVQLKIKAPAYTKQKIYGYIRNPTGVYQVTVNYKPDHSVPLSETVRVKVEPLPVEDLAPITENVNLADPRTEFQITEKDKKDRYDAVSASFEDDSGKTVFKVWSKDGQIDAFVVDEKRGEWKIRKPFVFSRRTNNLKEGDDPTGKYFAGEGADNTLLYVLPKSPNDQGQASLVLVEVAQNPATKKFDVRKVEYILPRGYQVHAINQSEEHVTVMLEHLDKRYPSSMAMKFRKWELLH